MYSHGYVICPSSQYKRCKKEAAAQQVDFYNNLSLYSVVLKFDEQPQNSVSIDSVLMGDESGFWLLTPFIPWVFLVQVGVWEGTKPAVLLSVPVGLYFPTQQAIQSAIVWDTSKYFWYWFSGTFWLWISSQPSALAQKHALWYLTEFRMEEQNRQLL